jgi:polysaccharide pyruvyl transferase WcaK-like protein
MGPFGFGNLGDAAIQQAMLQNLQKYYAGAQIYGFSLNPDDTEKRHGIPSFPIGKISSRWWGDGKLSKLVAKNRQISNPWLKKLGNLLLEFPAIVRAYKNFKDFDLFVVSGGGQLDDYWGGAWQHPYTLLLWAIFAKLRRTKYLIVSVGAGPVDAPLSRLFIKGALWLADYRSYRDEDSRQFIARVVGFQKDDPVYPDLAHSLDIEPYISSPSPKKERPLVGIGPMAYFDPRVWPERDRTVYLNYLNKLATFVTWLRYRGYDVLFFTGEAIHDRYVIKDLRELLAQNETNAALGQLVEQPIETVDDLMFQLATTDLVVASRFHGVLLAQLLNKPVLALSYHQKIDRLMEKTGQARYNLPIDRFEIESLQETFRLLEDSQDEVKKQIDEQLKRDRSALNHQYNEIFSALP